MKKEFRISDYIIPIILVFVICTYQQSFTPVNPIVKCECITFPLKIPVYNPYKFKIDTCLTKPQL